MQNTFRKLRIVAVILTLLCFVTVVGTSSYAWFAVVKDKVKAQTEYLKIGKPPVIYVLDSDGTDMEQLSLSGLSAGTTKQIIFCISQSDPVTSDSPASNGLFRLALVHTNNLAATYELYAADITSAGTANAIPYFSQGGTEGYFIKGSQLTYSDKSEAGNSKVYNIEDGFDYTQAVNQAQYQVYEYSRDGANNSLCYGEDSGSGLFNAAVCRFFILEVTVNDNNNTDAKEVDMIYLVARGGA